MTCAEQTRACPSTVTPVSALLLNLARVRTRGRVAVMHVLHAAWSGCELSKTFRTRRRVDQVLGLFVQQKGLDRHRFVVLLRATGVPSFTSQIRFWLYGHHYANLTPC